MRKFINYNYPIIIIFIVAVLLLRYPTPYIISTGGGIGELGSRIEIEGSYKYSGSYNLSYVSQRDGSLANILLSYFIKDADREKIVEYQLNPDETYEDINNRGRLQLKMANQASVINAYRKAGRDIKISGKNFYIVNVLNEEVKKLKIGDIIKTANGKEVVDFSSIVDEVNNNDSVTLKVDRDGKEIEETITVKESEGQRYIGIGCYTIYDYEVDPPISFKFEANEIGSSAGLMTTLAIYDSLTEKDLSQGLKIAGTGTIDVDGYVGSIDGVKHKISGAAKDNADLFFVPEGRNYEEALATKNDNNLKIEIVPVATLDDAINYLENLKK